MKLYNDNVLHAMMYHMGNVCGMLTEGGDSELASQHQTLVSALKNSKSSGKSATTSGMCGLRIHDKKEHYTLDADWKRLAVYVICTWQVTRL